MHKNHQSFFEILNKSPETKTVDLLIYGSIPAWDEDTYKMKNSAESFVKEFKALEKDYDRINIHINSPGGSLYHAFPIFNAILNSKKDIHTYNDGLAASAGGLLLLAGKKVHTAKNGLLMIHNALAWAYGNSDQLKQVASSLDTYDGIIAKLYAEKTGMTEAEVKEKYLNYKDHWLDADQAKEAGFIDEIEAYESEDAPPSNISQMAFGEVLNFYREKEVKSESFFDKIVNKVRAALAPANPVNEGFDSAQPDKTSAQPDTTVALSGVEGQQPQNQPQTNTMDFQNSLNILTKDQVTAEDLAAIRSEITAFTGANEKFTAEEVNAKIDAAKTEISNELTQVKAEKSNLETEVSNLKETVASYKASGVTLTNTAGVKTDPIPGEEVENFISETDEEIKRIKNGMAVK
jgi:ATP-dependent Clp protease, protease subunit